MKRTIFVSPTVSPTEPGFRSFNPDEYAFRPAEKPGFRSSYHEENLLAVAADEVLLALGGPEALTGDLPTCPLHPALSSLIETRDGRCSIRLGPQRGAIFGAFLRDAAARPVTWPFACSFNRATESWQAPLSSFVLLNRALLCLFPDHIIVCSVPPILTVRQCFRDSGTQTDLTNASEQQVSEWLTAEMHKRQKWRHVNRPQAGLQGRRRY
jgi:hypothetical protein